VEGCGLTVLEAMAHGTPVVAAASEAVAEQVADAARLAPVGDAEALAGALLQVLEDGALRERLVARGRGRVASRTPEAQARAALDSLRAVVEGGA
jgi:glycosyltransferase involved in cell wall biosynthesis